MGRYNEELKEALEWAGRCPGENCRVEVRRIFEMEDFPQEYMTPTRDPEDVTEATRAIETVWRIESAP
jgi:hypothetical protein